MAGGLDADGRLPNGEDVLVRVHSECLTGDVFGSLRCDCGPQLQVVAGPGRRRGPRRGASTCAATRAAASAWLTSCTPTSSRTQGRDTVDANLDLGLPADARDYGVGAQMLTDLGVRSVRLLTNNPDKLAALTEHGLKVKGREPIPVEAGEHNLAYLLTKRDRMGHDLPGSATPDPLRHLHPAPRTRKGRQPVSGHGAPQLSRSELPGPAGRGGRRPVAHPGHGRPAGRRRARPDGAPGSRSRPGPRPRHLRAAGRGQALAERGYDAVVALGVVIRGGTPHFEYVCQAATDGLTQVASSTGVAGRLRRADLRHRAAGARPRRPAGSAEDKGYEAVTAAVATAAMLRSVSEPWR